MTNETSATPDDIRAWLFSWFEGRGVKLARMDAELQSNFFEAGWIDSIQVIALISELEGCFGVRFNDAHFQDRGFPTIAGLAAIVAGLRRTGST